MKSIATHVHRIGWLLPVILIAIPASAAAAGPDQADDVDVASLAQPASEDRGEAFDVQALTARERAQLQGLVARALDDETREGSLASYWSATLSRLSDRDFDDVSEVYTYDAGTAPPSACRPTARQAAGNASYCPLDASIAYDAGFIESLFAAYGDVTPLAVLAHEWGHHVQNLVGFPMEDKAAELQADCYAGMYLRHLDDIGLLDAGDANESLALFRDLGDDQLNPEWNPEWYAEGVHGDSHERSQAQGVGFATGDPRYCDAYGDWADRPSTPFLGGVSVRRAPGTKVRAMIDRSYRFEAPDAEIIAWAADLPAGRSAADALDDELRSRFGSEGSLAIGAPGPGMLDKNDWATGEGARAPVERTTDEGLTQSGYAELQLHPHGTAEVFVAFPAVSDSDEANVIDALDALLWGYCDPRAPSPVNCATAPRPRPAPPAVEPPPAPSRPAPTPPSQDRSKSKTQRWQEQLLAAVRPFRDCALWTRRQEDRWVGKPNAYTYGARAAVQCGTPDTIRPTRGIRQLALFRFEDRAALESYWAFKLDKIGKPLRTTTAACSGGKQGIRTWSGPGGHGTIACYLADGRAKLRWTNERNNTYGIVDATHKDIKKLSDWWLRANVW